MEIQAKGACSVLSYTRSVGPNRLCILYMIQFF